MIAWLMLAGAIVAEVTGTLALRASDGFSRLVPSLIVVAGYVIAFGLLGQVVRTLPIGLVYAIWAGVGIALIAVIGKVLFDDPLPPYAIVGIVLIIIGVGFVQANTGGGH